MKKIKGFRLTLILFLFITLLTVGGSFALWSFPTPPKTLEHELSQYSISTFKYGLIYISDSSASGGDYDSAKVSKKAELNAKFETTLNANSSSSASYNITFYNSTDKIYYYHETQTVSTDNSTINYLISGIEEAEQVQPKSYISLTVTFSFVSTGYSISTDNTELLFKFTIDKESIGDIVATGAVAKFEEVLNTETAYETLTSSMDDRGNFLNKSSAITYIGNVAGADSGDSTALNNLFGQDFMSMDLDGDGVVEPITMIIKRENLDNNTLTGDSYSYSSWGTTETVNGVEMTIYITSQDLNEVGYNNSAVVYAAVFTKYQGDTAWTQILDFTKGTASVCAYSGGRGSDSFNTDTWLTDTDESIKTLVSAS